MPNAIPIQPHDFIERVQPLLEAQDLQGLLHLLKSRWTPDQIKDLLSSSHTDARKVACLALGLVGTKCCIPLLAGQLKNPDPTANEMAEHALWSIWFRCGTEPANELLTRGAAALDQRDFEQAKAHYTTAIETDPTFAEAYNQRAIVHYLQERYEESIEDCQQTIDRMPCHFGAWAGMGHCHAHRGEIADAIRCYLKALQINPHLSCVKEAVGELRRQLDNGGN